MMKSLASLLLAVSLQFSSSILWANSETVPQVQINTNLGSFTVELYPKKAPQTVANFLQYVNDGFYQDIIFHRLIGGYIAQAGRYNEDLEEKEPTYNAVVIESDNGLSNLRGTLAMAREREPNSGTSQFFINLADNKALDFHSHTRRGSGYTVFGKIIAGADILETLNKLDNEPQEGFKYMPSQNVVIQSMTVEEGAVAVALEPLDNAEEDVVEADDVANTAEDTQDEAYADADTEEDAYVDDAASEDEYVEDDSLTADATDETTDEVIGEDTADAVKVVATSTPTPVLAKPKPAVVPKRIVQPSKSRVPLLAKHLPEPPDIPAVE